MDWRALQEVCAVRYTETPLDIYEYLVFVDAGRVVSMSRPILFSISTRDALDI